MRLTDLDAQFVYDATKGRLRRSSTAWVDGMQGIQFQCPSCSAGLERDYKDGRGFVRGAHYIRVFFSNPRGVAPAPEDADLRNDGTPNPRWTIESGSTLDDLTLSPSIDCTMPSADGTPSICKFHGFVRNGDVA